MFLLASAAPLFALKHLQLLAHQCLPLSSSSVIRTPRSVEFYRLSDDGYKQSRQLITLKVFHQEQIEGLLISVGSCSHSLGSFVVCDSARPNNKRKKQNVFFCKKWICVMWFIWLCSKHLPLLICLALLFLPLVWKCRKTGDEGGATERGRNLPGKWSLQVRQHLTSCHIACRLSG